MTSAIQIDLPVQVQFFDEVNRQAEAAPIEPPFTADKLADLVNQLLRHDGNSGDTISKWQIFRLQQRGGVLFPVERPGRKPRYEFTRDDLRAILAIYRLRKYKLSLEECIEYTKKAFQSGLLRRTESAPKPNDDHTITGPIERARRYIWTRGLQYVLSMFFDTVPEGTAFVIDKLEHESVDGAVSITDIEPAWGHYTRSSTRAISDIQQGIPFLNLAMDISQARHQPVPTVLAVGHLASDVSYRIKIIWPHQGKLSFSQRGLWLLRAKPTRQLDCILRLLAMLFEEFQMADQPSTLHAIATAITQIVPEIDVCAILLPETDATSNLRVTVRAKSENLMLKDIPEHLVPGEMVLAWVYEHGLPLHIQRMEKDDWRVSDLKGDWSALAAIPVVEEPGHQIVFVGRRRELTGSEVFTQLTRDLLSILAGIVGVVNEAERSDADNLRRRTEQLCTRPLKRKELDDALLEASHLFFGMSASERLTGRVTAVTLAFAIANMDEIELQCGAPYSAWLEERILQILAIQKANLPDEDFTFCRLPSGEFVIVITQTNQPEDLFKKMSKEVTSVLKSLAFRRAGKTYHVQAYSWVLYFPYSYLQKKVSPWKNDQFVDLLKDRTEHALRNVARFESMSDKLRVGDFAGAETICREAIAADQKNPNLYKYMGEALFYQQKYTGAREALRQALDQDSQLPGARILNAQTMIALGMTAEGLKEYQNALEIKATSRYLALYGESLLHLGQNTAAIEQFNRAKELDPEHAIQYDIKIGEAYLGEEHYREAFNLFAALRELPEYYVLVEGYLQRARRGLLEVGQSAAKLEVVPAG